MAEDEEARIYNIPLGHVKNVPRTVRAPYAIKQIKRFVKRHMKVDLEEERIFISGEVNEAIWARGIQKPPAHLRVSVARHEDEEGAIVEVRLPDEEAEAEE